MAGADVTPVAPSSFRVPTLAGVFALGISCVVSQLALLREMLGVFAGNELVLGIVLGNWLLLMGLGAALGRRGGRRGFSPCALAGWLIFTAIVPPAQILVLRSLRSFAFLRGEAIGVSGTALTSFLVLLPFCLAAGYCLALACRLWAGPDRAAGAGRVYLMDSLGSVVGGALFTFVLVVWLDHIAMLAAPALLNGLAAVWLASRISKERPRTGLLLVAGSLVAGAGVPAWIWLTDPDATSTARQLPGQRLLFRGNSPYGRVLVTASSGQTNFIENGTVLASIPNLEQAEESVHFAMAQRPDAKHVLLIGGALSGAAREVLRYRVTALDCVELDPLVTVLGRRFLHAQLSDPRLRLLETDARQFVRRTAAAYDVVLAALPDPATAQINRFFTDEFFGEVRRVLHRDGVLSLAAGQYANYASPELAELLSCVRRTAAQSFRNVLLVPAGRVYFLMSDGSLTTDIAAGLERAGVTPSWVNRGYLAANLTPDRVADVERAASHTASVNHDFAPALYFLHARHWASQFGRGSSGLGIALGLVVLICLVRMRAVAGAMLVSGFAGSSLEVVLLVAMQTLVGALYRQVAWVVTLFMAGLAAGAWTTSRWTGARGSGKSRGAHRSLALAALAIALCAVVLPVLLSILARWTASRIPDAAIQAALLLFTFGLAALVGAQFPLANRALEADPAHPAARLYTADFLGAALGALLTSAWLLPLAGVAGVAWSTAGLNLAAGLVLLRKRESI